MFPFGRSLYDLWVVTKVADNIVITSELLRTLDITLSQIFKRVIRPLITGG